MAKQSDNRQWLREVKTGLNAFLNEILNKQKQPSNTRKRFDPEDSSRRVLLDAVKGNASDIHLDPGSEGVRIRMRLDGELYDSALLTHDQGQRIIRYFKALSGLDPVVNFKPQDARTHLTLDGRQLDLRLAAAPSYFGEKLSIRILDRAKTRRSLEELGLSQPDLQTVHQWLLEINGMCLVAGPTGSGKTTTLYALLHELKIRNRAIITIEDPIEYQIDGITQIQVDPRHGLTFAEGIKAILRLDPDYMLVGEIRDPESSTAAVKASTSGHVIMSTLHSRDAAGVVTSLRNWNVDDHQIAANLELVIAQRLARRLCPRCKKRSRPTKTQSAWLRSAGLPVPQAAWTAPGCEHCHHTGASGRIGIFEIWRTADSDLDLILNHSPESVLRTHLRQRGCRSLLDDGAEKHHQGILSFDELQRLGGFSEHSISNQKAARKPSRKREAGKTVSKSRRA